MSDSLAQIFPLPFKSTQGFENNKLLPKREGSHKGGAEKISPSLTQIIKSDEERRRDRTKVALLVKVTHH